MRVRGLPIAHPVGALGVVALGNLPDPVARLPGALRDVLRQLPAGEQPQDLPPAAFVRLFGCPVTLFQLLHAQVGAQMTSSSHLLILQWASKTWYQRLFANSYQASSGVSYAV